MAKVDKAIKDVGKRMDLFIFYSMVREAPLLYFDETKSTNVMVLAKAKLGYKVIFIFSNRVTIRLLADGHFFNITQSERTTNWNI